MLVKWNLAEYKEIKTETIRGENGEKYACFMITLTRGKDFFQKVEQFDEAQEEEIE